MHDVLYKIIIIGSSGVGKTNLLWRWMDDKFSQRSATINVEFATKTFQVNEKLVKNNTRARTTVAHMEPSLFMISRKKNPLMDSNRGSRMFKRQTVMKILNFY